MSEQRTQRLEATLHRILDALKTHYSPEQVIVFGSLATGLVTETSDLDLLIVKETDKRFFASVATPKPAICGHLKTGHSTNVRDKVLYSFSFHKAMKVFDTKVSTLD